MASNNLSFLANMFASIVKHDNPAQLEIGASNFVKSVEKFGVVESRLHHILETGSFPKNFTRKNMGLVQACNCEVTTLPHLTVVDFLKSSDLVYGKFIFLNSLSLSLFLSLNCLPLSLFTVWNLFDSPPALCRVNKLTADSTPSVILFNLLLKVLKPLSSLWAATKEASKPHLPPPPELGHQALKILMAESESLIEFQWKNRIDLDLSFTIPKESVAEPEARVGAREIEPRVWEPVVNLCAIEDPLPPPPKRRRVVAVTARQDITAALNLAPTSPRLETPDSPEPAARAPPINWELRQRETHQLYLDVQAENVWLRENLARRHPLDGIAVTSNVQLNLIASTAETTTRSVRHELEERVREAALGLVRDPQRLWHGPDLLPRRQ
jgi:hypothetical protein